MKNKYINNPKWLSICWKYAMLNSNGIPLVTSNYKIKHRTENDKLYADRNLGLGLVQVSISNGEDCIS